MLYQEHMSGPHHKALPAEPLPGHVYTTPMPLYHLCIRHYNRHVFSSIYHVSELKETRLKKQLMV
jgi:hypothetical protein